MDTDGVDRPILEIGTYRMTTEGQHGTRTTAQVKTYGDIFQEYEFHPEAKCADANGNLCSKQTAGLLQRRHIRIAHIKYIGKESNALEDVESGLIHSEKSIYTDIPTRDGMNGKQKHCP